MNSPLETAEGGRRDAEGYDWRREGSGLQSPGSLFAMDV